MKKLYLISVSALALSASAAFAQSLPAKTGTNVSAGNESYIDQVGSGNYIGTATATGVDQQAKDSTSGNYSEIYQGYGSTSSTGGQATVQQTASAGPKNSARTVQYGSNQVASTTQNNSGVTGNVNAYTSVIEQSNAANAATVSQVQTGGSALSTVVQTGSNNNSVFGRTVNGTYVVGGVNVDQSGTLASNESHVTQDGNTSGVSVTQTSSILDGISDGQKVYAPSSNTSTVNQSAGVSNFALIYQNASLAGGSAGSNTSTVTQSGSNGAVSVYQTGINNNESIIGQTGSGSSVTVTQGTIPATWGASPLNYSNVEQGGNGSATTVIQNSIASRDYSTVVQNSNSSTISVTQTGYCCLYNSQTSYVTQYSGTNNTATVYQTADPWKQQNPYTGSPSNYSDLTQAGDYNDGNVWQGQTPYGVANTSNLTQVGNHNTAYVKQH